MTRIHNRESRVFLDAELHDWLADEARRQSKQTGQYVSVSSLIRQACIALKKAKISDAERGNG